MIQRPYEAQGTRAGQQQDRRANERDYRNALGTFATGVAVVTTITVEGERIGLTVNSFTSVSLEPPIVSWCQQYAAATREVFERADYVAVNVLAADQKHYVALFASPVSNRFAGLVTLAGLGGIPLLPNAVATFQCRPHATHRVGDHVVHFAEVERYEARDATPLVFVGGRLCSPASP